MIRKLLLFAMLLSCSLFVQAQDLLSIKRSEFLDGNKERKKAFQQIRKATTYYGKGLGYVNESLNLFLEAYQVNSDNAELNYNIGICYLKIGLKKQALSYLEKAKQQKAELGDFYSYYLALAYHYQNDFKKAINYYQASIEDFQKLNRKDKAFFIAKSEKRIKECQFAQKIDTSSLPVENLGKVINSDADDFNPVISDGKLFYSSRRKSSKYRSKKDQKYLERIYQSQQKEGKFAEPTMIEVRKVRKQNVGMLNVYDSLKYLLFVDGERKSELYFAKNKRGRWKITKNVHRINKKKSRESSVCIANNGKELYFISNRKGGFGMSDIYFSVKNKKGKWQKPVNIGGNINTFYDEGSVFVTADGKEMYFSSTGHNSMGGYDIFKCERLKDSTWSKPVNMGAPVNTVDNDVTYFKSGNIDLFASSRDGGLGGYDLYKVIRPEVIDYSVEEEIVSMDTIQSETLPQKSLEQIDKESILPVEIITVTKEEKVEEEAIEEERKHLDQAHQAFYRVQIAACIKEMNYQVLTRKYKGSDVIEHLYLKGWKWHKYTIGGFSSLAEAAKYRDECGVKDAFVVHFKGKVSLGIVKKQSKVN